VLIVNIAEQKFLSWAEVDLVSWTTFSWIDFPFRWSFTRRAVAVLPRRTGWLAGPLPQAYTATATTLQPEVVRARIVQVLTDVAAARQVRVDLEPGDLKGGRPKSGGRRPGRASPPPSPYGSS
jgi:hypothetical protein